MLLFLSLLILQTLDVASLCIALEELTPTGEQLNNPQERTQWLHKAQATKPLVQKLLALVTEKPKLFGKVSTEYTTKCK